MKIKPEPTDISKVTDAALVIVNGYLADRSLDFEIQKEENASPFVVTDALKIREILVNILGNAVKFTDDGGKISFRYELNCGDDENCVNVKYTVADTGRGMSEEFYQHIFEEFAQESGGARTQYKGTGLGLSITKKYVDMLGGTISFESEVGQGTTFIVEFPMTAAKEDLPATEDSSACLENVRGLRILLAEDNELNAEIARIQL